MNRLSGVIPQGVATISFLSHLNLSYNNLSGKIPSGTQIQGSTPLSFIGNPELYGVPLTGGFGEDGKPKGLIPVKDDEEDSRWISMKWFYLGMPWWFRAWLLGHYGSISIQQSLELCVFSVPERDEV